MSIRFVVPWTLLAGTILAACEAARSDTIPANFSIAEVEASSVFEPTVGRVALGAPGERTIGAVTRVFVTADSMLVIDGGATRAAYLYSRRGDYVGYFGSTAQRPIVDGVIWKGTIVLIRDRLIEVFDRAGTPLEQHVIPLSPTGAALVGDRLCIHGSHPTAAVSAKIVCFDTRFREVSRFGEYEPMMAVYPYSPFRQVATVDSRLLAVTSSEEARVDLFDVSTGRLTAQWIVPGSTNAFRSSAIEAPARGQTLAPETRMMLRLNLHRFATVESLGGEILLWEQHLALGISNVLLAGTEGTAALVRSIDWPTQFGETRAVRIVGASDGELFGVVDEDDSQRLEGQMSIPPPVVLALRIGKGPRHADTERR